MTNGRGATPEFWRRGWFWALLALVSALPFVVAPLPMMPDYFSHTGRYHVMNHGAESPFLPNYYAFHWVLIGNLGVDLLMVPLGRLLPTEAAARIAAGIIPPLTVAGIFAAGRAIWGRIEAPALLALPFLYSFTFLYGFVNYHLGLALALLVLALFIRSADWPAGRRGLVLAVLAVIVWVVHLAAWAVLLVAAAAWAIADTRARLVPAALRTLPLAAPIVIMALQAGAGLPAQAYAWDHKLAWLSALLLVETPALDIALAATLAAAAMLLLRNPSVKRRAGPLIGAAVLGACFWLLPNSLLGSYYADMRLLAPMAMLLFLGLAVPAGRQAMTIAALGIALFGVRVAEISIGWHRRGAAAEAVLAGLDAVPRGARIAVAMSRSTCHGYTLLSLAELPSLAIVRRDAFVNTQWDLPGHQLMRPIAMPGNPYNDWRSVVNCNSQVPVAQALSALPRDRFDHLWVLGDERPALPWLTLVHDGADARLYRITDVPR